MPYFYLFADCGLPGKRMVLQTWNTAQCTRLCCMDLWFLWQCSEGFSGPWNEYLE